MTLRAVLGSGVWAGEGESASGCSPRAPELGPPSPSMWGSAFIKTGVILIDLPFQPGLCCVLDPLRTASWEVVGLACGPRLLGCCAVLPAVQRLGKRRLTPSVPGRRLGPIPVPPSQPQAPRPGSGVQGGAGPWAAQSRGGRGCGSGPHRAMLCHRGPRHACGLHTRWAPLPVPAVGHGARAGTVVFQRQGWCWAFG